MRFIPTDLEGAFIVELHKIQDERGSFARAFCANEFSSQGLTANLVQANTAVSRHKGTLRGMHYQASPHAEAKLVRCIRGAAFDVMIDLRPESPTYCRWFGLELSAGGDRMLYVPEGFAHGYQTLEDDTELYYLVSEYYTPEAERGVRWNDPRFNISWPLTSGLHLSEKDQNWPDYSD